MEKNELNKKPNRLKDRKVLLSTLWLFAILNYLYCDIITLMDSNILRQVLSGIVRNIHMTQVFLFGASILMEIPIAMLLLSRILNYKANRWANLIASIIMTVVQFVSLIGSSTGYYIFFSIIEISCTLFIFLFAFKWSKPEEQS